MEALDGATAMVTRTGALTVNVAEALINPVAAVIFAAP